MGQQQLLLLVLSTVIVGLATVAGIQAFSENQAQASQDALVQKATTIAADIQGLDGKPSQLGGIDVANGADASDIRKKLGYDQNPVKVESAGSKGRCNISPGGDNVKINCASANAPENLQVTYDPDGDPKVSSTFGSPGSVTSLP